MKKSLFSVFLITLITVTGLFAGTYSGGSGTSDAPYKIGTLDDLIELSNTSDDCASGVYFIQTAHIDASATSTINVGDHDGDAGTPDEAMGFLPIGNAAAFQGSYDGQGFTISNLYINRPLATSGLFRSFNGTAGNLGLIAVDITGGTWTGGFAGYSQNATITNCYSRGDVSGSSKVGGFTGYLETSTLSNCFSSGNVSGGLQVGGFVGGTNEYTPGTISDCYSTCNVTGSGTYAGGFVGLNCDVISNCYSTGNVSGNAVVGGFVGSNTKFNNEIGEIEYCYSTGEVSGSSSVGGFAGVNDGGRPPAKIDGSYWNTETCNQTSGVGTGTGTFNATGLATAQMKIQSNFTNLDFTNIWAIDATKNDGYPYLQWQSFVDFPSGAGTDVGGGTTINPSASLNFAADQTIPEIPNGSFIPDHEFVLTGSGVVDIIITTSSLFAAYYQSGSWHAEEKTGETITLTGINFDLRGDVPIVLGNDDPLPITLSSFAGCVEAGMPQLAWTTQSETDNAGWNVYRSSTELFDDGELLTGEMIPGAGNTSQITQYSWQDADDLAAGTEYWYWLESVSYSGATETFGPVTLTIPYEEPGQNNPEVPQVYGLMQNHPNPFNPSTEICFAIPQSARCTIEVYDISGRRVTTLLDELVLADVTHSVIWQGDDAQGNPVASGIYFYKMRAGKYTATKKMILMK